MSRGTVKADAATDIISTDTSYVQGKKYPYDPEHGSSLHVRFKWENKDIYAQVEIGTKAGMGGNDLVWVKNNNGDVLYQKSFSREDACSGEKYSWYGPDMYRRESEWINVGGASPEKPSVKDLTKIKDKYYLNVTSSSNNVASLTYDYYYYKGDFKDYVPGTGTTENIIDYLTGYYYEIDKDPDGDTNESSNWNTDGSIDVSDYVYDSIDTYYVHIRARSYTGKLSEVFTYPLRKTGIKFHSEDEEHNTQKIYLLGITNERLPRASLWWKHQRKGSTWIGWSQTNDSDLTEWQDGDELSAQFLEKNEGEIIDLYSVWDKPTATVEPTDENFSFTCNGTTYYKAPVEFEVKGFDNIFNVGSVSIWSSRDGSRIDSNTSSCKTKFGIGDCISTDLIKAYGKCTAGEGESETVSYDAYIDVTAPSIRNNVIDYGKHTVKASINDLQSGIDTVTLEYLKDGTWNEKTHYDTSEDEYSCCNAKLSVGTTYYDCKHRIKAVDHLGNAAYSTPFYVTPLQLTTALSKYNGDTAYNGDTLTFIAGGDLKATLKVKVSGYPDRIKYEYAPELGQATEEYNVTPDESGNVYETKTFNVPYTIAHDINYYVKVTAYRDDELISTIEYVKMTDIDFSKFKSSILYQSGQHN